jgi:nucleoside-diphosphate-sugar epimerase
MKKIAILGATSHIAKGLIFNYAQRSDRQLYLFARSTDGVADFLKGLEPRGTVTVHEFSEFSRHVYDVVINCVGIRNLADLADRLGSIFGLTEKFDDLACEYLERRSETLYLNFSSGAVFGIDFCEPVTEATAASWAINKVDRSEYYGIAKLYSEIKHRSLGSYNIVDLRVFGYFSRFIDLGTKYLLTEIIACLRTDRALLTDGKNIVRDYLHHQDLFALVERCVAQGKLNDVFDAYSRAPIDKRELLAYFAENYGLKYSVRDDLEMAAPTGCKEKYYSVNKRAGQRLGYLPEYSSLDCIAQEIKQILK